MEEATDRRTERRQAIVDAAQRLILHVGPSGCTTREVARECGLNKGLVYYYFPSAPDIVDAAMERYATDLREAIRGVTEQDPAARLRRVIEAYIGVFDGRPGLAQAWFEYLLLAERTDRLGLLTDVQAGVLAELTSTLGAPDRARIVMSYILGVLVRGIAGPLTLDDLRPEIETFASTIGC